MIKRWCLATLVACGLFVAPARSAERKAAFGDLIANLKSPTASTRAAAAAELGKSRRREAVQPLAALVSDPEPKVRLQVVRALRELRDPAAVPTLVTSMQDGDPGIRGEAIGTLVELYTEHERSTPVGRFLEIFSDEDERASATLVFPVDASVNRALAQSLRDEQRDVRALAAFALGILNGTSALPELTSALQDTVPDVRGAAASALGKIGSAADGKALIPLLADESVDVRNRVLRALGVLRTREAGPALREMYASSKRKETSVKVLESLARVADPAQADLFEQLVQDADPDRRRLAIEGLARVADGGLLPALKKDYQRTRDEELKLAYSFAIARLGDHAFLDSLVLCLPSRTLGRRCRGYLLELDGSVLSELYPYLGDADADVRAELCDVIGAVGGSESIEHLTPLIQDASPKVADRANRAVERLKRAGTR
jgi:HEAT repeat protein